MERITIFVRTTKTSGEIKLRFRLIDGREVQLYHKSDIKASLKDLEKFTPEGSPKPKVSVYNRALAADIAYEIAAMKSAYAEMKEKKVVISADVFEETIARHLDPTTAKQESSTTLLDRFKKYADNALRDGLIAEGRYKHYISLYGKLERYLIIRHATQIKPEDFTDEWLMDFRQFIFDEYKFVAKWKHLYKSSLNTPTERRNINTVTGQMKMLQVFFSELENKDEIFKNPFRRLGTERKKAVMRTRYDEPIYLKSTELRQVMNTEVPESLKETKDAFLLQCAFGCRVSDFKVMSMEKISVTDDGIPYVHYLPIKTKNAQADNKEVQTPILKYALEIIKRTEFHFPILNYVSGKSGYNIKIKDLLRHCGIDRQVSIFDDKLGDNVYQPLYEQGSSKLCRKTHVDMLNKVQINMYAAGLHKQGSDAVNRYTNLEIQDRFVLMCAAFGEPLYAVDKDLNDVDMQK